MNVRYPRANRPEPARPASPPPKKRIEIQDTFLFGSLKDERILTFTLVTGRGLIGRIKRFDKFTVLIESESIETLVYKHAILDIAEVRAPGR